MLSRVWLRAQSHEPVVWLLTGLWIPAIYFLLWSFIGVGAVDESAWIQWPAKGSRHESREPRALPETQVLGRGGEGQAGCYGERNVMRLTCLTGGLEKYPCPSGASEPSIIWKGSFHDEGYLCG